MVVGLRGLHRESHHRGCDGGWWSVVIGDLCTHNSETHPASERKVTQKLSCAQQVGFDIIKATFMDLFFSAFSVKPVVDLSELA